jgi:hypothetical protein
MVFGMRRILVLFSFLTMTAGMYNVCNPVQSLNVCYDIVFDMFNFKTGQS